MKYKVVRLVPWYLGCETTVPFITTLTRSAKRLGWKDFLEISGSSRSIKRWEIPLDHDEILQVRVYDDGIFLFSLIEPEIMVEHRADFDPVSIQRRKSVVHRTLLNGDHNCSDVIEKFLSESLLYRDILCLGSHKIKGSFSEDSYVFSFISFSVDDANQLRDISEACQVILHPVRLEYESGDKLARRDLTQSVDGYLASTRTTDSARCVEMGAHKILIASWATVVEIEVSHDIDNIELHQIERGLQHIWFYGYIVEKLLSDIFEGRASFVGKKGDSIQRRFLRAKFYMNLLAAPRHGAKTVAHASTLEALHHTSGVGKKFDNIDRMIDMAFELISRSHDVRSANRSILLSFFLSLTAILGTFFGFKALTTVGISSKETFVICSLIGLSILLHAFVYRRN